MRESKPLSLVVAIFILGVTAFIAPRATTAGEINVGYFGNVAIEGYDTVAFFTMGKAVKGTEAIKLRWLGADWHFLSEEHRGLFAENPMKYAPQYGGHCADGVAYGDKTANIDPESWIIVDNKLYLNSVPLAKEEFEQSAEVRQQAEATWPEVKAYLSAQ